jgi:sporulation protein YlmC with PRC-barrel domain
MWNKFALAAAVAATVTGAAYAQQPRTVPPAATTGVGTTAPAESLTAIPQNARTVANWYKQDVYDPSDNKIGEIYDVLVGQDGRIEAFIVSVGGFLGMGEKDVAVPFNAIHSVQKNGKWYMTMNATKDGLKSAHGYRFDKDKATWVPA